MSKSWILRIAGVMMMALFSFSSGAAGGVKEPNVAGGFYPGDGKELKEMIEGYLEAVDLPTDTPDDPVVLVVPHAGYVYSGPVAAHGFKSIRGKSYDTVVILAASHNFGYRGAAVYREGAFRTPLGDVPVDTATVDALVASMPKFVKEAPQVFEREHSLEVELPFLQTVLKDFRIVPVLFGDAALGDLELMGRALAEVLKGRRALVVVSTDLSHFKKYDAACSLDRKTIDLIVSGDILGLWDAVEAGGGNACGVKAVLAGMYYARERGAHKGTFLKYQNSGDTAGDKSRVVGYTSIIFSAGGKGRKEQRRGSAEERRGEDEMLTKIEKERLLEIARQAISERVSGREVKVARDVSVGLNLKRGAFVTLHKSGRLRGCIGLFTSEDPLHVVIAQMAVASATQDHRFSSVTARELKDIDIEISVLSEPKRVDDWKKIRLGTDGVIVQRGFSKGVFLPQVATETGWDLETFLRRLCSSKAGLPADAYKDPSTEILTFQAYVFSENDTH